MEHARKLDLTSQLYAKQSIVLVEEQVITPKKRSVKKFLIRIMLFFLIAIPSFLLLQAFFQSQMQIYSSKISQYHQMKVEMKKTNRAIEDSNRTINKLNDDDYIIELARKNLFFSKKGEIIFPDIK